jgi:DNA-directed RNA polymerase specialized sigma24 family protein
MREADLVREAFGDLHGPRLHGFALLVALGDAPHAERAAAMALAAGEAHATALRHPERAAAWLRARVLKSLRVRTIGSSVTAATRRANLAPLGVEGPVFDGLAALSPTERAALVAAMIEGFEAIDVEVILDMGPAAARRMAARAGARYRSAAARVELRSSPPASGGLEQRVQQVAGRALSASPESQ